MVVGRGGSDVIPGEPSSVGLDAARDQVVEMVTTSPCIGALRSGALLVAAAKAVRTRMTAEESVHGQSGFHFLTSLMLAVPQRRRRWLEQRATEAGGAGVRSLPRARRRRDAAARPSSTLEPLLRAAWKRSIAPGFVKLGLSCVSPAGPDPPVA